MNSTVQYNKAKKNTLVSGNAGDEKNLHPGGRNVFFFNRCSGDILFSSLVSFAFLFFVFFLFFFFFIYFLFFDCLFVFCLFGRFPEIRRYLKLHKVTFS